MATGLVDHFVALAENNAHANHRLLNACAALSPAEFVAPRTGFFPSLSATCHHILTVDRYSISAVTDADGPSPALASQSLPSDKRPPIADFADAPALKRAQQARDKELIALCDLSKPDPPLPPTRTANVLAHLFQQQIHHRGQAHAMLAGTAVAPPPLDEFFLAGDRALRRDTLLALGLPLRP
jgi:uncharacterized damage-inducible protein DinB